MPVEIEAKMKVADLSVIRERLVAAGAVLVGNYLETNLFFDTDDRSLLAADEGLRLRLTNNLTTNANLNTITFKGPRQHGQLKSRDETEVSVSDFKSASKLLECLGYSKVLTFKKRRQTWSLGNCRVELDELPHLGFYVEIEGPREDTVLKVRENLQLSDRPLVKASYIALLMSFLQERGESSRDVVFA